MQLPFNLTYPVPKEGEPGYFGAVRKFDIHTGIDLYCSPYQAVYAIESGVVVKMEDFTGEDAGSPWWNATKAVLVEGESGVIVYGEISPMEGMYVGERLEKGDFIGNVIPVLKKRKGDIPEHMLHLELMTHGSYTTLVWELDTPKPECLLNPERLL
jgi:hypothetical protein